MKNKLGIRVLAEILVLYRSSLWRKTPNMSAEEREHIDTDRIFYADKIYDSNNWMFDLLNKLTKNVYITFDLDVLDPSIMPSTGTPEPGGMLWYQVIDFLRTINQKANVVGFDIVELCPNRHNKAPDFLAAKLLYQMLTYKFINHVE